MQTAPPGSLYSKMNLKVQTGKDGIELCARVKTDNFAWISDETELLMCGKENCDSILIHERFYKSGFGLAYPENWPYKKHFDNT
jgi:hypothetical protein